jgi:nucleotide-binding universal stress UspA family protein
VVNPDDYSIPEFADKAMARAKSMHRLIANEVDYTPAFTSSVIAEGDPKKVILRIIEEWSPDCVFLAPHGRNRFSRALFGGVSGSILAQAKCTVEIARIVNSDGDHGSFLQAAARSSSFNR